MKQKYDFIILGTGAAGLSLAYHLYTDSFFQDKKILLIDKEEKNKNDRTWSFWTNRTTIFDEIVSYAWDNFWFRTPDFEEKIKLKSYQFKTIKGIDFYNFVLNKIQKKPQFELILGEAQNLTSHSQNATVQVNGITYKANYIFNTIPLQNIQRKKGFHYFLQHFKGWVIQSEKNIFDPKSPTFMDFRIPQKEELRFFYILPHSPKKALVEFTIFSENLLKTEEYEKNLKRYIHDFLHIDKYEILEEEWGVIPMYDIKFSHKTGKYIFNLGTVGGQTRASSGFTFMNIQRACEEIIELLKKENIQHFGKKQKDRFRFYDSMLLEVIQKKTLQGKDIFRRMFQKHDIERILRFLDNESSFGEDLKIMASMPSFPFMKAFFTLIFNKI